MLPLPTANEIDPLEHLLQINKRKDRRKEGTGRAAEGHTVAISRGAWDHIWHSQKWGTAILKAELIAVKPHGYSHM